MMFDVTAGLGRVLAGASAPIVQGSKFGAKRPGGNADLPAIAVSLALDNFEALGLGRLVRSWDQMPNGSDFRKETSGDRYAGTVALEVWAGNSTQANGIARDVELRLATDAAALRQAGFVVLHPSRLDAAENATPAGANAGFSAWKQSLSYKFVFESHEGGDVGGGEPIRRVDVDVVSPPESFSTP